MNDISEDLPIPEEPGSENSVVSFGTLRNSQLLGDREALRENDRSVITIKLGSDPVRDIDILRDLI